MSKTGVLYKRNTHDHAQWTPYSVHLIQNELHLFDFQGRQCGGLDLTTADGPAALTVQPILPATAIVAPEHTFQLETAKGFSLFAATDEVEMNEWVFALLVVLRANVASATTHRPGETRFHRRTGGQLEGFRL
ncbi:Aste57867_12865 [Aphanomyces stellatus]|uniref:Aste57867_12865 protein n=1 Tax=Aphanomyces stellatus TaxID=120398 RepID=A0A485KX13_9STRA|nr:hypothetical protein As57867_012817 [Aphanomyces stellatus]VFT89712.1 Aste57867_12865 [Aphanomyces stellatus]